MKIEVLGTGCPKCKKVFSHVEKAVAELGLEAEVIKIYDSNEITERGVLLTPALAVNGEVKVSGEVPSIEEVKNLIA